MRSAVVPAKSWDAAVLGEEPWGDLAMRMEKWQTCAGELRAMEAAIL
jgi:hypothetical protein